MDFQHWCAEEQIAQRLLVGYQGTEPSAFFRKLLGYGLGGVILFADNLAGCQTPADVRQLTQQLLDIAPAGRPRPWMSVDQEGGQVERLSHKVFPSLPTPLSLAQTGNPDLARQTYALLGQQLYALGFTMNFAPTLDVNLRPENPVIGVRSFGNEPETVWRFARTVPETLWPAGVVPVAKHFPGHGNGDVDSHLALPVLHFTEAELSTFHKAIQADVPAVMVAHGYYPALQSGKDPDGTPASLSKTVVNDLLRERLGFSGVIMTDDLWMGAVTQHEDPVSVARKALNAGCDVLLYRAAGEAEEAVFAALVDDLNAGRLDRATHEAALRRILALKERQPKPEPVFCEQWAEAAQRIADSVVAALPESRFPIDLSQPMTLLLPDRRTMGNYAMDVDSSPDLDALVRAFRPDAPVSRQFYTPETRSRCPRLPDGAGTVVLVSWLPKWPLPAYWPALRDWCDEHPHRRLILISAGLPTEPRELIERAAAHWPVACYRPPILRALARRLAVG
jgi:beta-N-acetylhexosaminidase